MKKTIAAIIAVSLSVAIVGCGRDYKEKTVRAEELTSALQVNVEGKEVTDGFKNAYYGFTSELFKRVNGEENVFISPLSAATCLSMAFNGADGETLSEFESAMGLPLSDLNGAFKTILSDGNNSVKYANSIWLNAVMPQPKREFLNAAKGYYGAEVYRSTFDVALVSDINNWVSNTTQGMIDNIIDKTSPDYYSYLLNVLYFEAEWAEKYENKDIKPWTFRNKNGEDKAVTMLSSTEHEYFSYNGGDGFLKRYKGDYAFMAILPEEGTDIDEFISGIDGEKLLGAISDVKHVTVKAKIPEFKSDFSIDLCDALKDMGIISAFSPNKADFSKMSDGVYIDFVLQKTKIELDRKGTKAAAVTGIGEMATSVGPGNTVEIVLDRPFVYAIISLKDDLPLFIGSLKNIG